MRIDYVATKWNVWHFRRHKCRVCSKVFETGDFIVKHGFRKYYHRECYEAKLL